MRDDGGAADAADGAADGGHRVLVFAQLRGLLDIVARDVLQPAGVPFLRLDGGCARARRGRRARAAAARALGAGLLARGGCAPASLLWLAGVSRVRLCAWDTKAGRRFTARLHVCGGGTLGVPGRAGDLATTQRGLRRAPARRAEPCAPRLHPVSALIPTCSARQRGRERALRRGAALQRGPHRARAAPDDRRRRPGPEPDGGRYGRLPGARLEPHEGSSGAPCTCVCTLTS